MFTNFETDYPNFMVPIVSWNLFGTPVVVFFRPGDFGALFRAL